MALKVTGMGQVLGRMSRASAEVAAQRVGAMIRAVLIIERDLKTRSLRAPRPAPVVIKSGKRELVLLRGGTGGLAVDTGSLRAGIVSEVLPPVAGKVVGVVGTTVKWAPIHETGGVIRPTRGKYLSIPVRAQQAGTAARRIKAGKHARVGVRANARILVRSVKMPARRPFGQTRDRTEKQVVAEITGFLRNVVRIANGP